jgi:hypothetical protein
MDLTRLICMGPLVLLLAVPAFASEEPEAAQSAADQPLAAQGAADQPEAAQSETEEPAAPPAISTGLVARASFTSAIDDREPVDSLSWLANDQPSISFFTELRQFSGQTVVHRWEFGGEVVAEVPFQVGADRWRVWSTKRLLPEWLGEWTVSVIDGEGKVLETRSFSYAEAETAPEAETAAEAGEADAPPAPAETASELGEADAPPADATGE